MSAVFVLGKFKAKMSGNLPKTTKKGVRKNSAARDKSGNGVVRATLFFVFLNNGAGKKTRTGKRRVIKPPLLTFAGQRKIGLDGKSFGLKDAEPGLERGQ